MRGVNLSGLRMEWHAWLWRQGFSTAARVISYNPRPLITQELPKVTSPRPEPRPGGCGRTATRPRDHIHEMSTSESLLIPLWTTT